MNAKETEAMIYTEWMEVEAKHFGLVIGRGASGLRHLASMPGITAVEFVVPRSRLVPSWPLTVRGTCREVCRAALDRVSWRIVEKAANAVRFPAIAWLLLPEGLADGQLSLRPVQHAAQGDIRVKLIHNPPNLLYVAGIQRLKPASRRDESCLTTRSRAAPCRGAVNADMQFRVCAYKRAEVVAALAGILAQQQRDQKEPNKGTVWRFRISPGQELYTRNTSTEEDRDVCLNIKSGQIDNADLSYHSIRPFFANIFVEDDLKKVLECRLGQLGYRLTQSSAASYTSFRIKAGGSDKIFAHVTLADSEEEREEKMEKKEDKKKENEEETEEKEKKEGGGGAIVSEKRSGGKQPKIWSIVINE